MLTVHMFSMSTCGPCKQVKPILEEFEKEYPDLTVSYTVVDQSTEGRLLATEWEITGVPTLLFIADGEEKSRVVGAQPKETLRRYVEGFVQRDVLQEQSGGGDSGSCAVLRDPGEQAQCPA